MQTRGRGVRFDRGFGEAIERRGGAGDGRRARCVQAGFKELDGLWTKTVQERRRSEGRAPDIKRDAIKRYAGELVRRVAETAELRGEIFFRDGAVLGFSKRFFGDSGYG